MPHFLEEAVDAAYAELDAGAATPPSADAIPTDSTDETSTPSPTDPQPSAALPLDDSRTETPDEANPTAALGHSGVEASVDTSDLKSIKDQWAAKHPELEPVLAAALKEMERGVNRKFEQVAALRKDAAEQVVRDEMVTKIPVPHLQQIAQIYQMAYHGNKTEREAAADYLFQMSEAARQEAQNAPADPYQSLPPEVARDLQQLRAFTQQQTQQQIETQVNSEWQKLQTEFGSIPDHQKQETYQAMNARGMNRAEDIGMVWRGLFGWNIAKKKGIEAGHALRQEKAGLGTGNVAAVPPPPTKNKDLWSELNAICDSAGVR